MNDRKNILWHFFVLIDWWWISKTQQQQKIWSKIWKYGHRLFGVLTEVFWGRQVCMRGKKQRFYLWRCQQMHYFQRILCQPYPMPVHWFTCSVCVCVCAGGEMFWPNRPQAARRRPDLQDIRHRARKGQVSQQRLTASATQKLWVGSRAQNLASAVQELWSWPDSSRVQEFWSGGWGGVGVKCTKECFWRR